MANIIIIDSDEKYTYHLTSAINARLGKIHAISGYFDTEKAKQKLKEEKYDIVIANKKEHEKISKELQKEKVILLTQNSNDTGISKYSSVSEIIKATGLEEEVKEDINKTTKITAIFSFCESAKRSAYALKLAKEHSQKEKTLYVNFESYSELEGEIRREERFDISMALYEFRKKKEADKDTFTKAEYKNRLDIIEPTKCPKDLIEASKEDLKELFTKVGCVCGYSQIIFDAGQICDPEDLAYFCDEIIMPVTDVVQKRTKNLREHLRNTGKSHILKKITQKTLSPEVTNINALLLSEETGAVFGEQAAAGEG